MALARGLQSGHPCLLNMKLILSSNDFSRPDTRACILANLPVPVSECRLLYIPNEKVSEKQMKSSRFQEKCARYGFLPEHVAVLNYYHTEDVRSFQPDAVYLGGGNTFSTFARIRDHGFADTLCRLIRDGAVYLGGSCGAHIVSENIEHVKAFDEDRVGFTDYSGLGLFHGVLVCHYTKDREPVYERLKRESSFPVFALRNGDSLVVENGAVTLVPRDETIPEVL